MGITERKLRQKEELRRTILAEARKLVLAEGFGALSIRKLAEAIEYSVPVVYDHFCNKEAILHEFIREGFSMLTEKLEAETAKQSSPESRLEAIAQGYWNFAFENREYYQIMFGVGMPSCETVNSVEEVGRFSGLLQVAVKDALVNRSSGADPFLKLHSFWSMLHGLVSINLLSANPAMEKMNPLILQDMTAMFIKGL